VPERSSTGEVEFVLALTRDVSEQKRADVERQLMDLQLRQAQKMEAIGQLAAGIAHEINTPTQYVGDNTRFLKDAFKNITAALNGYTELIGAAKQNAVTPELIARAEEIVRVNDLEYHFEQIPAAINETLEGVERVANIVRAMKEFSHPGGREKTTADLNKAIESTVTVARNEWKYVADMVLELDPGLPLVPCFISEFNQAILNLVVNAAHAIGGVSRARPMPKGRITIRTRRDGDHVEVRVSDTGTGISEEHRPRIFEPFFTTKDVGKGTGQGLTVVYSSIVKKHRGTVTFETETGKGTTFILRLPVAPKPGVMPSGATEPPGVTATLAAVKAV
jgi:signal transduction histidine kinase